MNGPIIRPLQPEAAARLFCLPYAGASAALYRDWAREMPAEVEVVPLELPGRGARYGEPLLRRLDALVADMAPTLAAAADRPFVLFGHSMGALLAFELARALEARGRVAGRLVVSAHRAPQLATHPLVAPGRTDAELLEQLRRLDGIPAVVWRDPELLKLVWPVIRADLAACAAYDYQPGAPLRCPLLALGGERDPLVTPAQLEAWREQTGADFRCARFPSGHFFLQDCRPALLRVIRETFAGLTAG